MTLANDVAQLEAELAVTKRDRITLQNKVDSLFPAIAHGSVEHGNWLDRAIAAHFSGAAIPPMPESKPEASLVMSERLRRNQTETMEESRKRMEKLMSAIGYKVDGISVPLYSDGEMNHLTNWILARTDTIKLIKGLLNAI